MKPTHSKYPFYTPLLPVSAGTLAARWFPCNVVLQGVDLPSTTGTTIMSVLTRSYLADITSLLSLKQMLLQICTTHILEQVLLFALASSGAWESNPAAFSDVGGIPAHGRGWNWVGFKVPSIPSQAVTLTPDPSYLPVADPSYFAPMLWAALLLKRQDIPMSETVGLTPTPVHQLHGTSSEIKHS